MLLLVLSVVDGGGVGDGCGGTGDAGDGLGDGCC